MCMFEISTWYVLSDIPGFYFFSNVYQVREQFQLNDI